MARMPNNVTIGLYTTGAFKVAYELTGRSARRFAIKGLAAPRVGPRERVGPIDACGVHFLAPRKTDAPGIGRVACCMELHGFHGFHGLHGALVYLSPPPSVPTKNAPPLQGTPPAYPAICARANL